MKNKAAIEKKYKSKVEAIKYVVFEKIPPGAEPETVEPIPE